MGKVKEELIRQMEEASKSSCVHVWFCVSCELPTVNGVFPPEACSHAGCEGDDFWHERDPGAPCNRQSEEENVG